VSGRLTGWLLAPEILNGTGSSVKNGPGIIMSGILKRWGLREILFRYLSHRAADTSLNCTQIRFTAVPADAAMARRSDTCGNLFSLPSCKPLQNFYDNAHLSVFS
jgi:hypothetical protein